MPHLLLSAAHKSSGKTTISIGLCAALTARGTRVQAFKKGPDYIDPMWLAKASNRDCHNLDFYVMQREEIRDTFARYNHGADLSLIEGNKGLYDGLDLDGSNSNAALAELLGAPVVLVIDCQGMTRGIAPLILGYQAFGPEIRIAGVIMNQLRGSRHEAKLRAVIEHYTDVPVLGAVYHDDRLNIDERHLGLVPSNESGSPDAKIALLGEEIGRQVDLDRLLDIAATAPAIEIAPRAESVQNPADLTIGVIRDAAFGFYYPGDLQALRDAGGELVFIDALRDRNLPAIDALFIGGGFPETHMQQLEANHAMRTAIRDAIEAGLPAYAECGGLMYLARRILWNGNAHHMAGVIPGDIQMHERPQGRGYVRLRETGKGPWPLATTDYNGDGELHAHEFHYSSLGELDAGFEYDYAFEVLRGTGITGKHDGLVHKNLLACYTHQRDVRDNHWAARFVEFARRVKRKGGLHKPVKR